MDIRHLLLQESAVPQVKYSFRPDICRGHEMYYEQGDTIQEIAKEQNICIGTVQERLGYIRKKLINNKEKFFL